MIASTRRGFLKALGASLATFHGSSFLPATWFPGGVKAGVTGTSANARQLFEQVHPSVSGIT